MKLNKTSLKLIYVDILRIDRLPMFKSAEFCLISLINKIIIIIIYIYIYIYKRVGGSRGLEGVPRAALLVFWKCMLKMEDLVLNSAP